MFASTNLSIVYFYLFLILINFSLIPLIKVLSIKFNLYDFPNKRKLHLKPISYLGGTFFLISHFFYLLFYKNIFFDSHNMLLNLSNIYSLIFVSVLVFFLGLLDDKIDINPLKKTILLLSLFTSAVLIDDQIVIENINFEIIQKNLNLKSFSFFFTIACIYIFVNACNMYDGADLQIGIYFFTILIYLIYKTSYFNLFIPIFIPLVFFLFLNFKKFVFIGNSGSHFVSYIIALLLIKFYNVKILESVEEVIILMLVPGLDLCRLFFSRIINNKKFFHSDLNHIHHKLLKKYTKHNVQIILFFLNLFPIILAEIIGSYLIGIIVGLISYFYIIIKKT